MWFIILLSLMPLVATLSPFSSAVTPVQPLFDKLSNCSHIPSNPSNKCLTTEELFRDIGVGGGTSLSSSESLLILQRLASATCYASQVHTTGPLVEAKPKPTQAQVWGLGLLFVTLISICSLLGVSVMPLMDKSFYNQILTALIGLAVGSLSASSIFHLIPQVTANFMQ